MTFINSRCGIFAKKCVWIKQPERRIFLKCPYNNIMYCSSSSDLNQMHTVMTMMIQRLRNDPQNTVVDIKEMVCEIRHAKG